MRVPGRPDADERLRAAAAHAKEQLREACRAGDRRACGLLQELGELAPVPRHWSETDDSDREEAP